MDKPNKTGMARFRSDILWQLQPFIDYQRNIDDLIFMSGNIVIEPHPTGGAVIVGVTQHAMGIFHDPDGHCSAPMTIKVPDNIFKACSPKEAIPFTFCGEDYPMQLPEWTQPAHVNISNAGIFVTPKMRHPEWSEDDDSFHPVLYQRLAGHNHYELGIDYEWNDGTPVTWQKPLQGIFAMPSHARPDLCANPTILGLYSRIHSHAQAVTEKNLSVYYTPTGINNPILVQIENYPCFVGALMPIRKKIKPREPDWFKAI